MTDARDLLQAAIQAAGGQGLCNPDQECGCGIDDLAPGMEGCIDLDACKVARWTKPKKDDIAYIEEFEDGYFKVVE